MKASKLMAVAAGVWLGALGWSWPTQDAASLAIGAEPDALDRRLAEVLAAVGLTGNIEATLEQRLGRPLDSRLVDLGRLLFFDNVLGLHEDNSCAGCHTPAFGFGDSQSIAIGVQNNGVVGPDRTGPRNQRKAPLVINSGFLPKLMLNGRFVALSGDPFDNSLGFQFPLPEGTTRFPPNDPAIRTLLAAQGHIPQTELVEMAGFTGATRNALFDPKFHQFDDGLGTPLPRDKDGDGFLNEEIRSAVLKKLNAIGEYVSLFADVFEQRRTTGSFEITFAMVGQALAEFQLSLTFANAPIDRFARGEYGAMPEAQKRGALLFFGTAGCIQCHAVAGDSNEMFSDFRNRVLGIPQIAPLFGAGTGNVVFDGPAGDEDFGAEQITGDPLDRYRFRSSPLRNVATQPAFFHNGAFTRLDDAIRHHLDARLSAESYNPATAGVDSDLWHMGPLDPVLARLDPALLNPVRVTAREFSDLVAFVRDGLLDPRATRPNLCRTVPAFVPSGIPVSVFQGCE